MLVFSGFGFEWGEEITVAAAAGLRLFQPDTPPDSVGAADCLGVVFEREIVPKLQTTNRRERRKPASAGHVKRLRDTVELWDWATNKLPIGEIDEPRIDRWIDTLPLVAWQRGPWGVRYEISPQLGVGWRRYSASSLAGHQDRLSQVLAMLGPPAGRALRLGILVSPPTVPLADEVDVAPKDVWTTEESQQIAAACERMGWWGVDVSECHARAADWWRAWVALSFYTGLRTGTIADLQVQDYVDRPSGKWLHVRSERASKTGKAKWVRLHRQAVEAIEAVLPLDRQPGAWLLERVYRREQAGKTFRRQLLSLSELPPGRHGPAKLWRATHIAQIKQLGASLSARAGQAAADHSQVSIGDLYYADTDNLLRPLLPDLWPGGFPRRLF